MGKLVRCGRWLGLVPLLGVLLAAGGCGIGEAVTNDCLREKRVFERAQKRQTSLVLAGVPRDAVAHRAATDRLATARAAYTECAASQGEASL